MMTWLLMSMTSQEVPRFDVQSPRWSGLWLQRQNSRGPCRSLCFRNLGSYLKPSRKVCTGLPRRSSWWSYGNQNSALSGHKTEYLYCGVYVGVCMSRCAQSSSWAVSRRQYVLEHAVAVYCVDPHVGAAVFRGLVIGESVVVVNIVCNDMSTMSKA